MTWFEWPNRTVSGNAKEAEIDFDRPYWKQKTKDETIVNNKENE